MTILHNRFHLRPKGETKREEGDTAMATSATTTSLLKLRQWLPWRFHLQLIVSLLAAVDAASLDQLLLAHCETKAGFLTMRFL